jgi:hypothetical protein
MELIDYINSKVRLTREESEEVDKAFHVEHHYPEWKTHPTRGFSGRGWNMGEGRPAPPLTYTAFLKVWDEWINKGCALSLVIMISGSSTRTLAQDKKLVVRMAKLEIDSSQLDLY